MTLASTHLDAFLAMKTTWTQIGKIVLPDQSGAVVALHDFTKKGGNPASDNLSAFKITLLFNEPGLPKQIPIKIQSQATNQTGNTEGGHKVSDWA